MQYEDLTVDDARAAVAGLRTMLDEIQVVLYANGVAGAAWIRPGSQAEAERNSFPNPKLLDVTVHLGCFSLLSVGDHLWAFTRGLEEPALVISPVSNLRVQLEAAANTMWVFDPAIGVAERVARGYALRVASIIQQRKILEDMGETQLAKDATDKIAKLEKEATALGCTWIKKKPDATPLAGSELGRRKEYRVWSAAVHGHFSALNDLAYSVGDPVGDDMRTMAPGMPVGVIVVSCQAGAMCAAESLWRAVTYLGLPTADLIPVLERGFAALKINNADKRPWMRASS